MKDWAGAYPQSTIVTVQILINNGYHDNDKRQDNAKSKQYKREFTHGSAKKKEGRRIMPLITKKYQQGLYASILFHMQKMQVKPVK
ncbi:hypothetical protein L4A43_12315 [Salmonella enterica subsp. diarizonae serovar 16:z10:e,n,x,z15]|uniref:hypothetical protein n=1 Tax=Salmonella enterica TaxID=28901 RepID=UPI001F0EDA21|nr:hypothetical protein [Salmonella enterica subsp. diarizonae]MCH5482537.1 hypothetical protein [Salmonella enterica subsp. diarizonae serovar 16:z10:e,n,x,z15]